MDGSLLLGQRREWEARDFSLHLIGVDQSEKAESARRAAEEAAAAQEAKVGMRNRGLL